MESKNQVAKALKETKNDSKERTLRKKRISALELDTKVKKGCSCKGNCCNNKCGCVKKGGSCEENCKCSISKCKNQGSNKENIIPEAVALVEDLRNSEKSEKQAYIKIECALPISTYLKSVKPKENRISTESSSSLAELTEPESAEGNSNSFRVDQARKAFLELLGVRNDEVSPSPKKGPPGAKMSFRVVRSSKFRHVYGQPLKREQCYDNIRVSKSSWDSTFCAVNPKFLAIIVESAGGGAFIVLPHNKVGRISPDHPLVGGHKGPVLDIAWCPHNDNVIASGSEDCLVKVWQIPDGGISRTLTESVVDLQLHQRRVGLVLWHPTALNVLLTAGSDNLVIIWNVGTGEPIIKIECHPDVVYSACWNWEGSRLVTTCKDKKIRIIDPRSGKIIEEAIAHEGSKATRAIFLRGGLIFTTGFSKMSERQYSLRAPDMLAEPIVMVELDTSNGVMFPLYDPDTNLVYLCGKGDSVIRYFEITPEPPFVHYINTFQTPDPQRGIGMMPKRGCDVNSCEIMRFYRLNNSGFCQVISMTVPRKSELFQEDLYPDTPGDTAAISAEEWEAGTDAEPLLISLRDGYQPTASKNDLKVHKKANVLSKGAKVGSNSTSGQSAAVSEDIIKEFSEEIRKLKAMIVKHEGRIRVLESAVALQMKEQDRNEKSSSPVDKESLASDEV